MIIGTHHRDLKSLIGCSLKPDGVVSETLQSCAWHYFRFLDDPRVPLDNNGAERALRGVVVGRKNHYGSRSKKGTEVAALFYTLFESAKLAGVDPYAYVLEAAKRAIRTPGSVTLPTDLI